VVKFGGWYKVCIWEKIIIPEIKNANIVITELYNLIHYLSNLLGQQINFILLQLQLKSQIIEFIIFSKIFYFL